MRPDRSQKPSAAHPMGVAVCGTPIEPGLFVFTNEMRVGKVRARDRELYGSSADEWFDVVYRDGSTVMQNPERVATTFTTYDGEELVAEERAEHHDFTHSRITGDASCRYCGTIGIGDDEDTCAGVKTYVEVGDDFTITLPWSEVCLHLGVQDKTMLCSMVEGEMVQLWADDGGKFSFPITPTEAGLYHGTAPEGYYYHRKGWDS